MFSVIEITLAYREMFEFIDYTYFVHLHKNISFCDTMVTKSGTFKS